ncbi:MAG: AMP-binding protein, partial [Sulfolobus sp.]|nr:AMP-binding protein [Sulfolobus sp.]
MSWEPTKEWIENSNVYKYMIDKGFEKLEDFISFTYENPETFWDDFVKLIDLNFDKPYTRVLDLSQGKPWAKWFIGGELNIGKQIPDTNEVFVKWVSESGEKRELTYHEVLEQAKSVASWLHKIGLKKGDRVAIYLPMIPDMIPIFIGIIRAGMIVIPLFSGFGKEPIRVRLEDSQAKVLFASDISFRKGKEINMYENITDLNIEKVIVNRSGRKYEGTYDYYSDVLKTSGDHPESTSTEDPLMIIYTSGTTGKPKGCVHTHDGFPIKAAADIYYQFDMKRGETLMWLTDMGWMMGPWMVFGALLLKGKIGMIEGYIDLNTLIKFAEDLGVDILGFSASLIRLLRKESPKPPSLKVRVAGNTGEPID